MFKNLKISSFILLLCAFFVASASAETQGGIAAKVGDKEITVADLDKASTSALISLQAEMYQIRKKALDLMIADELFEKEAQSLGQKAADLKRTLLNRDEISVSEEDILKFYQDNSYYFQGKPIEGFKVAIRDKIIEDKINAKEHQVVSDLKKKYGVQIFLEEPTVGIDIIGAPARGPMNAKITLVEFSDFQCPYCARFSKTVDRLVSEYPNDIHHVFRHNPLPMHANAKAAHHASVCAQAQGKFWEFRTVLFDHQSALTTDQLHKYAESTGLAVEDYDKCMADPSIDTKLDQDVEYARSLGADGTPTSFINGRLLSGARPYEELKATVDEILHSNS